MWSPGKPPTDEGTSEGTQRKWANNYSCLWPRFFSALKASGGHLQATERIAG